MEQIKYPAIKMPDGIIILATYHGLCHLIAKEIFKYDRLIVLQSIDGFVTEEGRFVDRIEGLEIAKQAGQIVKKYNPIKELLSEDLRK